MILSKAVSIYRNALLHNYSAHLINRAEDLKLLKTPKYAYKYVFFKAHNVHLKYVLIFFIFIKGQNKNRRNRNNNIEVLNNLK